MLQNTTSLPEQTPEQLSRDVERLSAARKQHTRNANLMLQNAMNSAKWLAHPERQAQISEMARREAREQAMAEQVKRVIPVEAAAVETAYQPEQLLDQANDEKIEKTLADIYRIHAAANNDGDKN